MNTELGHSRHVVFHSSRHRLPARGQSVQHSLAGGRVDRVGRVAKLQTIDQYRHIESPKLCSPSCSPRTSTCSHHSNTQDIFTGCPSEPEFPIRLQASILLTSLTFYICTPLLHLFTPVLTPASLKFHSISARQKVFVLSLILVPLSGTHCHCTLEMLYNYRHLQVCSKKLSLQPPRI